MKLFRPFLLILCFALTIQAQASLLAITHVTVVDMTGAPARQDMTVIVANSRIISIGKKVRVPESAKVIDGTGKFLIPGLWDMHVHFKEVERTFPMFIANGVTGVRNVGGDLDQLVKWRSEVASGRLTGPRIVTCGPILDGPNPSAHGSLLTIADAKEGRAAVDLLKSKGADCIKVYDQLTRDAYFEIIKEAKRVGLPVVGHVPLALTADEAANAGQRSIEHLGNVFESATSIRAQLIAEDARAGPVKDPSEYPRRIAARGERMLSTYDEKLAQLIFKSYVRNHTWQVPTLETKWSLAFFDELVGKDDARLKYIPASELEYWTPQKNFFARYRTPEYIVYRKKLYQKELDLVRDMHRAGVMFMTGTDLSGAYVFAGFSVHHEMELLVQAGLSPYEALQAATRNPALFLRESKDWGTIEKGKLANLVILSANPLEDIRNSQKIDGVVLNGRYLPKSELQSMLVKAESIANRTLNH